MIGSMKRLLMIVAALLVLLVVGAIVFLFSLDAIAAETIRRGGTYALGVETTVDDVDVGLGSEVAAELSGLAIANPEGFDSELFLGMGAGSLHFPARGLFADVVEVPELKLDAIEIHLLRRGGRTNYDVILENLARLGPADGEDGKKDDGGGKRFAIGRIVMTDVDATIDLLPLAGEATRVQIRVPEIVVEDLRSDMSTAEVFGLVIQTLLTAVLQNGAGLLPEDMLADLSARLNALGGIAFDVTGGAVETSQKILSAGGEVLKEGAEKLGEEAGEVLKGLGGVLKKKD